MKGLNNYSKITLLCGITITCLILYYGKFNILEALQFISSMGLLTIIGIGLMEMDLSPLKNINN